MTPRRDLGTAMLALARAWFDDGTLGRVFEPLIADWQRECEPKSGIARVVCQIRGGMAFATSFALTFASEFLTPLPSGLAVAAGRIWQLFVAVGVIALYAPFMWNSRGPFEWVLPSTLGYALPLAITPFTVILLTRENWPARQLRLAALRAALATTLVLMPLLGWGVPYANQQWRIAAHADAQSRLPGDRVAPQQPVRGVRELTLPELWSPAPLQDARWSATARRKELVQRASLIFLPAPLVILGIAAARIRVAPRAWACFWWIAPVLMLPIFSWWRTIAILLAVAAALHVLTRHNTEVGTPRRRNTAGT